MLHRQMSLIWLHLATKSGSRPRQTSSHAASCFSSGPAELIPEAQTCADIVWPGPYGHPQMGWNSVPIHFNLPYLTTFLVIGY